MKIALNFRYLNPVLMLPEFGVVVWLRGSVSDDLPVVLTDVSE